MIKLGLELGLGLLTDQGTSDGIEIATRQTIGWRTKRIERQDDVAFGFRGRLEHVAAGGLGIHHGLASIKAGHTLFDFEFLAELTEETGDDGMVLHVVDTGIELVLLHVQQLDGTGKRRLVDPHSDQGSNLVTKHRHLVAPIPVAFFQGLLFASRAFRVGFVIPRGRFIGTRRGRRVIRVTAGFFRFRGRNDFRFSIGFARFARGLGRCFGGLGRCLFLGRSGCGFGFPDAFGTGTGRGRRPGRKGHEHFGKEDGGQVQGEMHFLVLQRFQCLGEKGGKGRLPLDGLTQAHHRP